MNSYLALGTSLLTLSLGAIPQRPEVFRPVQRLGAGADSALLLVDNLAELGFDLSATEPFIPDGLTVSETPTEGSRAVLGDDERVKLTSQSYPWSAIGRISGITPDGHGYICTSSLVATDIVLTNAHCVVDTETGEPASNITFKPNLINGQVASDDDIANGHSVLVGTGFSEGDIPHPDDWALVALDRPLGNKYGTLVMAPVPTTDLADQPFTNNLVMVGYSGDFPADNPGQTASAHVGCSIVDEWEEMVLHACDTYGGSSGGPILAVVDGETRIVALNSAEATDQDTGEGIINAAVKIPRIINQLRALGH